MPVSGATSTPIAASLTALPPIALPYRLDAFFSGTPYCGLLCCVAGDTWFRISVGGIGITFLGVLGVGIDYREISSSGSRLTPHEDDDVHKDTYPGPNDVVRMPMGVVHG